jgi:hypothetical protein
MSAKWHKGYKTSFNEDRMACYRHLYALMIKALLAPSRSLNYIQFGPLNEG